jgi:hypothetical protein
LAGGVYAVNGEMRPGHGGWGQMRPRAGAKRRLRGDREPGATENAGGRGPRDGRKMSKTALIVSLLTIRPKFAPSGALQAGPPGRGPPGPSGPHAAPGTLPAPLSGSRP